MFDEITINMPRRIDLHVHHKTKKKRKPKLRIVWSVVGASKIVLEGGKAMFQISNDASPVGFAVEFLDKKSKPAKVDGTPTWTVSDPAIAVLVVGADGLSCTVAPSDAGTLGTVQLNISADADMGPGVRTITGSLDLEIVASEAATAVIKPVAS